MQLILGAICGDVIGSSREFQFPPCKETNFKLFEPTSNVTDDSILTIATMDAINENCDYALAYKLFGCKYPTSYGQNFSLWLMEDGIAPPYNSYGNGSGMRVSPIGWAFDTMEKVLDEARKTAICTHSHPEGIKGAQAIAAAVYLARKGKSKKQIKTFVQNKFGYNLNRTCDEIRPEYMFDVTCQGSVPEAIIAFLESKDYESAVRLSVSLGGDADTLAAMTGSIAEAFYGSIPKHIYNAVLKKLTGEQLEVIKKFSTLRLCQLFSI